MTAAMETKHDHSGGARAGHAGDAVLHHDATLGRHAHPLGREHFGKPSAATVSATCGIENR